MKKNIVLIFCFSLLVTLISNKAYSQEVINVCVKSSTMTADMSLYICNSSLGADKSIHFANSSLGADISIYIDPDNRLSKEQLIALLVGLNKI